MITFSDNNRAWLQSGNSGSSASKVNIILELFTRRCSFETSISHGFRYVKRAENLLQSHHCVPHILA
ncbi:hypothetical protein Bca4012_015498 [Brassica carinata]|uniref:Uncharacterized protein n=1 Tax=Brassica carinata TaxID=52824 RepID=A0A8X7P4N4_BRACI|nr:hypothetical protein Bca52824_093879 [Brassica carinata]